ncbi:MAG: acyl-CoA thioesterase, partial [Myxococcales bacterium]
IVHHANYLQYFEAGRVAWLKAHGVDLSPASGVQLPVVDAHVRYRKPARFDDAIEVATWLAEIKGASMTFAYAVWRGDELLCEGETRLACVGPGLTPQRIPEALRVQLETAPATS